MTQQKLYAAFAQNRTEELARDVWSDFVAPTFLPDLDLLSATKPRIIVGGRGCGKTMLLRYFSYESQFSKKRPSIPSDAVSNIGIYWRIDTQFATVMNSRGFAEADWIIAFEHYLVIFVSSEILRALRMLGESNCDHVVQREISELRFSELEAFSNEYADNLNGLLKTLQKALKVFELWVSNVRSKEPPVFLPKSFITSLIDSIRAEAPSLANTSFHVFVDEFENLLEYQQRAINTRIKHSQKPLIFSVAMKRRGFATQDTLGAESITEIDDYRKIDLEWHLEKDFPVFAGEVLILNLAKVGFSQLPVSPDKLRNPSLLDSRRTKEHKKVVLDFARQIFPGVTEQQLARQVFEDESLRSTLQKRIESGLIKRLGHAGLANAMMDAGMPKESVVCSALVHRKKLDPQNIIVEFQKKKAGESSKFDDWVDNNFIGCLLQLYEPHNKVCPFYAGFETFVLMSKGNLRHLLELCSKSIALHTEGETDLLKGIPVNAQARAAKQASAAFLQEVKTSGNLRAQLHAFVLRIGSLFALAHERSSQSQPEVNHFTISGGLPLSGPLETFLCEAIKWTVLFEEQETKGEAPKDGQPVSFEYVLNPIYAPYFNISYRKRRSIDLRVETFRTLVEGNYEDVSRLLRQYSRSWEIDLDESSPMLFSHLSQSL